MLVGFEGDDPKAALDRARRAHDYGGVLFGAGNWRRRGARGPRWSRSCATSWDPATGPRR